VPADGLRGRRGVLGAEHRIEQVSESACHVGGDGAGRQPQLNEHNAAIAIVGEQRVGRGRRDLGAVGEDKRAD
jgi:hypothetical protein